MCYNVTKYLLCKPLVVCGVISLPDAAAIFYDNKARNVCGSFVFSTGFVMQYYLYSVISCFTIISLQKGELVALL